MTPPNTQADSNKPVVSQQEGPFKAVSEYVPFDPNFVPGPKNGHWTLRDPYPALDDAEEASQQSLMGFKEFAKSAGLAEFKKAIASFDFDVPERCPKPGLDLDISYLKAPVRDGHEVELKVYASKKNSGKGNATLIFRMHGGGWTIGKHETEEAENRVLAGMENYVLVSVDYRLAPEYPFPVPLHDCFDVLKWCQENHDVLGINPQKVVLTGCSAGGNLAAALCILARDTGLTGIIGQHLAIPPMCHPKLFKNFGDKYELLSYIQNNEYPMLTSGEMESAWDYYTGMGEPEADPLHSPLVSNELSNLPPALLHIAGRDPLRDEGIAYAEKLQEHGNDAQLVVIKGLGHGFYTFTHIKETWEYFERIMDWMKRVSDRSQTYVS